jgi:hypothetical protein
MQSLRFILTVSIIIFYSNAQANELTIYTITPKLPINWKSPFSLALTTGINSVGKDYAPIGHFSVKLDCSEKNVYGISSVLTGMERESKKESQRIVIKKKLGLGSLIYPFKGKLASSKVANEEIELARLENRLKVMKIAISKNNCISAMDFVNDWIESGSYTVYGGSKDVNHGEGAGCADFAMNIFKIATGTLPPRDWIIDINIQNKLIGNAKEKEVNFLSVLKTFAWAKSDNIDSTRFKIVDGDKVFNWINKKTSKTTYEYSQHLFPGGLPTNHPSRLDVIRTAANKAADSQYRKNFTFSYDTEIPNKDLWYSIKH